MTHDATLPRADTAWSIALVNLAAMLVAAYLVAGAPPLPAGVPVALGMVAVPCGVALLASLLTRSRTPRRRFLIVAWIVLALMLFGRHIEQKRDAQQRATPGVTAQMGV